MGLLAQLLREQEVLWVITAWLAGPGLSHGQKERSEELHTSGSSGQAEGDREETA